MAAWSTYLGVMWACCCFGIALIGGFSKPLSGLSGIRRHAGAVRIHEAQVELRHRVPLIGCLAKPERRLHHILWHAVAVLPFSVCGVLHPETQGWFSAEMG